jgi:endonuclease YncB( thermonuclease family)
VSRFILLMVLLGMLSHVAYAQDASGIPRVIDGDTIDIDGTRIRLHGIDAPESAQLCQRDGQSYPCGQQATLALDRVIDQGYVTCNAKDIDRYGRIVAVCFLGNIDLNGWLVSQGYAIAYLKYSTDYAYAETLAKAAKRGVWAGEFLMPWEWRKGKRFTNASSIKSGPSGCAIKGNISNSGQIYHMPGGHWYDKTKISLSKGERWFCSEAEAIAAGWRKAKR